MIQQNELRIGSVIEQGKIIELKINGVRVEYISDKKRTALVSYEDLKPIPITEEKLLELGFLSIEKNDVYKFDSYSNGSQYRIYYDTDYKEPVYRIEDIVSVKYVHELQNLFFSLTKQELIKK